MIFCEGFSVICVHVANPSVDYSARPSKQMFDTIEVKRLEKIPGVSYPPPTDWVLSGAGFNQKTTLPVLEDLFVFTP